LAERSKVTIAAALIIASAAISPALASELTAKDVRTLISMVGLSPGAVRLLGDKGLHRLIAVRVVGRRGHFRIFLHEVEVSTPRAASPSQ
jgi:hypothetical protein